MQQEVTVLEIDWSEATGTTSSVGSPYLFGWLRAYYIQPGMIADGQVVVIARTQNAADWTRYQGPVSEPEAVTLVCMLAGMNIPDRVPRIASVPDSSNTFHTSSVRIVVERQAQSFTVESQGSGFRGEDADELRAVFQRILSLAGDASQHSMFTAASASKA